MSCNSDGICSEQGIENFSSLSEGSECKMKGILNFDSDNCISVQRVVLVKT